MQHKIMRLSTNMVTIIPQTTAIITMNPAEMVSSKRKSLDAFYHTFFRLKKIILPLTFSSILYESVP